MSLAATELADSSAKVIDVALKYGYSIEKKEAFRVIGKSIELKQR